MVSPSSNPTSALLQTHRDLLRKIHDNRNERASVVAPSEHKLPDLPASPSPSPRPSSPEAQLQVESTYDISHVPEAKRRKYEAYYPTYCWDEETIRNDLPERYSVAGEWGGNSIHGAEEEKRCEEYPRQRRLLALKSQLLLSYAHPPLFLPIPSHLLATDTPVSKTSVLPPKPSSPTTAMLPPPPISMPPPPSPLATHLLQTIGFNVRFDSIHITPPPEMPWSEVLALPIRQLSTEPGFVFLWVGKGNKEGGLEKGREALTKWGFRKCEEIVWVKTNKTREGGPGIDPPTDSIFQNTKEHCLMGIRGTVRRATDGWFVHTNIDTDVMVWEGDAEDPHRKPPEIYSLIENFCLGLRRLDLFGEESRARPGWVTAGFPSTSPSSSLPAPSNAPTVVAKLEAMVDSSETIATPTSAPPKVVVQRFNRDSYPALVTIDGKHGLPSTNDIESLRPKSPNKGRPHSSQSTASATLNNGASRALNLPSRPASSTNLPPVNNPYNNMVGGFPGGMMMPNGMVGGGLGMGDFSGGGGGQGGAMGGMGMMGGGGGGMTGGGMSPQQQQQQMMMFQQQQQHQQQQQQPQHFVGGGQQQPFFGGGFFPQQQQQQPSFVPQQNFGQHNFQQQQSLPPNLYQQQLQQQQQQAQHQQMLQEQAMMQQMMMMGQFPGQGGFGGGGFNQGGQGGGYGG